MTSMLGSPGAAGAATLPAPAGTTRGAAVGRVAVVVRGSLMPPPSLPGRGTGHPRSGGAGGPYHPGVPSRSRRVRESLLARLAAAGDLAGTLGEADAVLRAAVGAEGSAWGTVDPATTLSTSCARFGALAAAPDG